MPNVEELELPEAFAALPAHYRPVRTSVNRLSFPSPFAEYPGCVSAPLNLSATDYHTFWTQTNGGKQPIEDLRHPTNWIWETRFHLITDWKLQNVETSLITKDPTHVPDQRIIRWICEITQPIIERATSLPNWQGPSKST